ncbi:TetR/AcrR family transcriptional regulator [Paenibacillaceae bacterium WGS1546]|uniref:TetR/AcrR family transcriptional regulator n=1 Tax=Cohnella sp. WGS1546 TaxID=3366810 RepID=UPI00372D7C22
MYHINEDQRSIQSKNMLYRALSNKMREKDFQSITIKEVVSEAQMGRSTFYRNFHNLESVLLWKCDETFQDLYRCILQSVSPSTVRTGADKFPFTLPFFRYWLADSEIIELLIAANRLDIIFSAFDNTMKKLVLKFNPGITKMSPHFEYFLAFRSGAMIRILLHWIHKNKDLSPEALCKLIEAQSEGFYTK